MTIHLVPIHQGSTQIQVFRGKNVEPHLLINGAEVSNIDKKKVEAYVRDCDWTDKGASAYITPQLKCDDFLLVPLKRK